MPVFYCDQYFSIIFSQMSYFCFNCYFLFFLGVFGFEWRKSNVCKIDFYLLGTSLGAFLCYLNGTYLIFRTKILPGHFCWAITILEILTQGYKYAILFFYFHLSNRSYRKYVIYHEQGNRLLLMMTYFSSSVAYFEWEEIGKQNYGFSTFASKYELFKIFFKHKKHKRYYIS